MIDLRILGTLDLRDRARGGPVAGVLAQPKRLALLIYLAAATPRGSHSRETLLLLFWPNASDDRARNSLNQAVFNLRRALGEAVITGSGDELRVPDDLLWCDAVAFEQALAAGEQAKALELYGGDLLSGFHLDDCIEFERWLDGVRQRLRDMAVAAALSLAGDEEHAGNGVAAAELLRRAVIWAPYDEPAVARLVAILARMGDRAGAIREFERFEKLLEADLSLTTSAELQALADQIRRGDAAPIVSKDALPLPHPTPPTQVADNVPSLAPVSLPTTPSRRRSRVQAGVIAFALVVGAAVFVGERMAKPGAPADAVRLDKQRVLVAAFENRTGDRTVDPLGYMAADWITQALARTSFARVVPFSTVVQETPHLAAEGSAPEVAAPTANRQFARRIGAGVVVLGSYYRAGDSLVFQAQVIDVVSGELLRAIDDVRGSAVNPSAAMEELQRRTLGALATLFDARLESWRDPGDQPSTLEAYRLFSEGMTAFMRGMNRYDSPERVHWFSIAATKFTAAAADSSFTLPLLWGAYAHMNRSDTAGARQIVTALEGRSLSPWSRAVLNHLTAGLARDLEAQYQAARELAALSPDSEWLSKLARSASQTGRWREALAIYQRMDPERGWLKGWGGYWRVRVEAQHVLGNYAAALEDARRGRAAQPDDGWLETQELWALAALGHGDELAMRLIQPVNDGDPYVLWRLNTVLEELRGHGRSAVTARLVRLAIPAAESLARSDPIHARGLLANLLYLAGSEERAAALYDTLMHESPRVAQYRVRSAILAARRGDRRPAVETLKWLSLLTDEALEQTFPDAERGYWGSARGWLALQQARVLAQLGERDRAVEMLHNAIHGGLAHTYLHLHDDPDFDPLRRHSGFKRLLRPRA